MIWGGSALGLFLARSLERTGTKVKLIMSDVESLGEIVDEFQDILILRGEGTNQELLIEENIHDVDVFIAASLHEEDNILASLLAKKLGAQMSMALVNKATYLPLVSAIGVDVVVSSHVAAASAIFRHIHAGSILSEFSLKQHEAGFIEIQANEENPFLGKPLKTLKLPAGILISAIVRGDTVIIPSGDDTFELGDHVVIFVLRSAMKRLKKLLGLKLEFLE